MSDAADRIVHGRVYGFGPLFVVQAGGDIATGRVFSVGHAVSGSPVTRLSVAALILTAIVFSLSILARLITKGMNKHIIK